MLATAISGQDEFDLTHTYDELNRLTSTTGQEGQKTKNHTYTYDSLGNLVYELIHNKGQHYTYNILNQQIEKLLDDKDEYYNTFDKRGNFIESVYEKNSNHSYVMEQYVYDASNRMVKGINAEGEEAHYIYNGLGYLVANEWIITKNGYGYHGIGINLDPADQLNGVVVCDRHSNVAGNGHINPTGKGHTIGGTIGAQMPVIDNVNFAVVHKDYVLDYTSPLQHVIMETESGDGGLTYRYVYGLNKVETVIYGIPNGVGSVVETYTYPNGQENIVKLYYHHDHLGSTDYLTDNIAGEVKSYITYDDWGQLTAKAVLQLGVRELDLVQEYTGHPYDQVLDLFYAKARMYDA
jgi:YD repeat-containing protein